MNNRTMISLRFILALLLVLVSLQGPVPAAPQMVAESATSHCGDAGCAGDHAAPAANCCPASACLTFAVPMSVGGLVIELFTAAYTADAANRLSGRDVSPEPGPPRQRG